MSTYLVKILKVNLLKSFFEHDSIPDIGIPVFSWVNGALHSTTFVRFESPKLCVRLKVSGTIILSI